jgi:bifunctional DNA-binding transcriptional regulator/antitoxin component of YhaV-PrlF toxin-antitoxin module
MFRMKWSFHENSRIYRFIVSKVFFHYIDQARRNAMAALTVTARGQVTFRKDVLQHLGVRPGERIEVDKLPDGRVALKASRPSGKIEDFLGFLGGKTKKVATLEEIDRAAAAGWAGRE